MFTACALCPRFCAFSLPFGWVTRAAVGQVKHQVRRQCVEIYEKWLDRVETLLKTRFVGFLEMQVFPSQKERKFMLILRFDCVKNLNRYLHSPERLKVAPSDRPTSLLLTPC